MATNHDNNADDSSAPPRLMAALQQSQAPRVFVPPTVDEAVLRAAQAHLAPAKPRESRALARWLRWPAFATVCVLLCAVAYRITRTPSPQSPPLAYVRGDLNRDGRVDILDAFQLARQLQSGDQPGPDLDFNGDGVVDSRDANTIAAQAVKLEKGGRS